MQVHWEEQRIPNFVLGGNSGIVLWIVARRKHAEVNRNHSIFRKPGGTISAPIKLESVYKFTYSRRRIISKCYIYLYNGNLKDINFELGANQLGLRTGNLPFQTVVNVSGS
jgi:hypothetical protein